MSGSLESNVQLTAFSLEEEKSRLQETAKSYGWDFERLEEEGKLLMINVKLYDFEKLKNTIEDAIYKIGAKRLVIDPGVILKLYFDKELELRKSLLDLGSLLKRLGVTAVFTAEPAGEFSSLFGLESYVADGVILLYHTKLENEFIRTIAIMKMRGTSISEKLHPVTISKHGLVVLSEQEIFHEIKY